MSTCAETVYEAGVPVSCSNAALDNGYCWGHGGQDELPPTALAPGVIVRGAVLSPSRWHHRGGPHFNGRKRRKKKQS